jgi:MraZ protein
MFTGEFEHSVDDKGRLTIPAKFRDELASGVVVTRGLDNCLWAFSRSEWEKLAEKIATLPKTSQAARNFTRFMFASASESIPDRQGRVLIPQNLRDYAGISNETAVIGVMDRVEIWNPDRWSEAFSNVENNSDEIAAQLHELGFNI